VDRVQKARRDPSGPKANKVRLVRRALREQPDPQDPKGTPVLAAKLARLDHKVFPALRGQLARWDRKALKEPRATRERREIRVPMRP